METDFTGTFFRRVLSPLADLGFHWHKHIFNETFEVSSVLDRNGLRLMGRTISSRRISACLRLISDFKPNVFVVCFPGA
jgi:hypothetical protein